ncbi:hypothetical protein H4CHR_02066 [Variovorax sp. PBS-H4]|uniref:hypothetical protein n=1 Tax=Variovorax sp. PBS-H4 TaxID=434008 RepID=UPI001318944D|nr:hypothetical protein [Variovorax sp. PBS-H4]VTU27766.1 hypothetical protein H4CHR_02066 [Variovorax sp. PBS-H4]
MHSSSINSRSQRSSSNSYITNTPENTPPNAEVKIKIEQPQEHDLRLKVPALNISVVRQQFAQEFTQHPPRLIRQNGLKAIRATYERAFTRAIKSVRREMGEGEIQISNRLIRYAEAQVQGGNDNDYELSRDIDCLIGLMQAAAAEHPGNNPDAEQQRRLALIDLFSKVLRNEFSSDAARWGANIFIVGLRTGLIVALCTFMRDAIDFEVHRALALHGQDSSLYAAGMLAIAIAPTLNLMGGVLSGLLGTANAASATTRVILGLANLGLILACYQMGALDELGEALPSFVCYGAARDVLNFFFPLGDNLTSLPTRGIFASGSIYAFLQWLGGMTMGIAAPLSGAHGFPRAVGNETVSWERIVNAKLNISDSAIHGLLNGFVLEVGDDLVMPAIVRKLEQNEYRSKSELNVEDEIAHKEYITELIDFAKQLLQQPAEIRQKLIDEKNIELYKREWRRMTNLPKDLLDPAHKQYLVDIENQLRPHFLKELWDRTPAEFTATEMKYLWELENELGVYKKTRELERMEANSKNFNAAQLQALKDLQEEVADERRELLNLQLRKKSNLDYAPEDRLRHLRYEFDNQDHLDLAILPMSLLGAKSDSKIPSFSTYDADIRRVCRKHYHLKKKDILPIVEELYVHEFVRVHLPFSTLTPVEREVRASILKKTPAILPVKLLSTLEAEVEEKRRKDAEGLRIRLGVVDIDSAAALINRAGRTVLLTNAARQSVFASLLAAIVVLAEMLEDRDQDRHWALDLFPAALIFVLYACLYLMHMEGASPGRPVDRPGAQGGLPPIREDEPEVVEEVITPRDNGPHTFGENGDDRKFSVAESDAEISSDPQDIALDRILPSPHINLMMEPEPDDESAPEPTHVRPDSK